MKRFSTERYLALGMALTADKATMERRVRNIFARKSSANAAKILSLALCIALGVGCFTTACRPAEKENVQSAYDFDSISSDLPAQTHVPDLEYVFDNAGNEAPDDTTAYLATCVETAFSAAQSSMTISESETKIADNAVLVVDADISVPETDGYSVTRLRTRRLTPDEYRSIIGYFLSDAIWQTSRTAQNSPASDDLSADKVNVSNGFSISIPYGDDAAELRGWSNGSGFLFKRREGIVYREGYLINDEEMEAEFGEEIRKPISLAREDAQALSDKAIKDLGLAGLVLDSAQRACLFGDGYVDGKLPVLTRGWSFAYTQDNNGLRVPEYCGHGGGTSDPLKYVASAVSDVQVYVDGDGVSVFWCNNLCQEDAVLFENVAIISVQDALRLFKDRIAHVMSYADMRAEVKQIDALGVSLSSMAIADDSEGKAGGYLGEEAETSLMIPVWRVQFRITYTDGQQEYCTYPFSATDGGALSRMNG